MKQLLLATAAAAVLGRAEAQNNTSDRDFVWGAVVLNLFGDRIPLLSENYSVITPTGQNQMFQAGQLFRDLYITGGNNTFSGNRTIQHISSDAINLSQVNVTTMSDVWIQQSAQAFMEGLYPPLNDTVTSQTGGPLSSLQNPMYYMASSFDPTSIVLNGSHNCPAFEDSVSSLLASQAFKDHAKANQHYFDDLGDALSESKGAFPGTPTWYGSSYLVWDWLQHAALNDSSLAEKAQGARYAADAYMQEVYGDAEVDGGMRAIGGYMMAATVLDALYTTMAYNATYYTMNLFFTGPEPWMSLAALLQLTDTGGRQWQGMPDPGSSLVFELFSNGTSTDANNPTYPGDDAMHVRVLLRNGTNSSHNLNAQAIFGQSTSAGDPAPMTFQDFWSKMASVTMQSPGQWCEACSAKNAVFCAYYTGGAVGLPYDDRAPISKSPITPTIGGVIGAFVTLAVLGLAALLAFCLFGVRLQRHPRQTKDTSPSKRPKISSPLSSPRGGFKGGEKLASDVDLPRGARSDTSSFGATIVNDTSSAAAADTSGHRRIESWEMREGRRSEERVREAREAV